MPWHAIYGHLVGWFASCIAIAIPVHMSTCLVPVLEYRVHVCVHVYVHVYLQYSVQYVYTCTRVHTREKRQYYYWFAVCHTGTWHTGIAIHVYSQYRDTGRPGHMYTRVHGVLECTRPYIFNNVFHGFWKTSRVLQYMYVYLLEYVPVPYVHVYGKLQYRYMCT